MIIHHYTNLEALAMILSTRTLKFSRLDCVDDLEEGNIESDGLRLGNYMFVSCWTENEEESIPLWKMYGGVGIGIRISMDSDMFQDFLISDLELPNGIKLQGSALYKLPLNELIRPDYFVLPIFGNDSSMFYRKIEYVDDVDLVTKDIVKRTMSDDIHGNVSISFADVGKYKHKRWAFQEESRFAITILPGNPLVGLDAKVVVSELFNALYNHSQLPFTSYFLHIKPSALNAMTITLNPSVSEPQRILVKAICEKYAPGAIVKESSLAHNVNIK